MFSDDLKPGDFHFRAGIKTELDRNFLRIIDKEKTADITISEFIKQAVVNYFEEKTLKQQAISEAEAVRKDLEARIQVLEAAIRNGVFVQKDFKTLISDEKNLDKEVESKIKALTMAF